MKIGDLVKYKVPDFAKHQPGAGINRPVGIIIETGVFVGRKDIKVLWNNGDMWTEQSKDMEVINESR